MKLEQTLRKQRTNSSWKHIVHVRCNISFTVLGNITYGKAPQFYIVVLVGMDKNMNIKLTKYLNFHGVQTHTYTKSL